MGPYFRRYWTISGNIGRYRAISGNIRWYRAISRNIRVVFSIVKFDMYWVRSKSSRTGSVNYKPIMVRPYLYDIAQNNRYRPIPLHRDIYRTVLPQTLPLQTPLLCFLTNIFCCPPKKSYRIIKTKVNKKIVSPHGPIWRMQFDQTSPQSREESVLNCHRHTDRHPDWQTDMATLWLNGPRGADQVK